MKICLKCGKGFEPKNTQQLYCNLKCYRIAKQTRHYKKYGKLGALRQNEFPICIQCGSKYKPTRQNQKYCSLKCVGVSQKKYFSIPQCLKESHRKIDKALGYVRVYRPDHPMANTWGYAYEHRLVIESNIGRFLNKDEHVHHINGVRWDNSLENLKILSASEHGKL